MFANRTGYRIGLPTVTGQVAGVERPGRTVLNRAWWYQNMSRVR
jgi:hypothetical protein